MCVCCSATTSSGHSNYYSSKGGSDVKWYSIKSDKVCVRKGVGHLTEVIKVMFLFQAKQQLFPSPNQFDLLHKLNCE